MVSGDNLSGAFTATLALTPRPRLHILPSRIRIRTIKRIVPIPPLGQYPQFLLYGHLGNAPINKRMRITNRMTPILDLHSSLMLFPRSLDFLLLAYSWTPALKRSSRAYSYFFQRSNGPPTSHRRSRINNPAAIASTASAVFTVGEIRILSIGKSPVRISQIASRMSPRFLPARVLVRANFLSSCPGSKVLKGKFVR